MRWHWTNHPAKTENLNSRCAAVALSLASVRGERWAVLGFAAAAGAQARRTPAAARGRCG